LAGGDGHDDSVLFLWRGGAPDFVFVALGFWPIKRDVCPRFAQ
jgi:hypothetical protein